MTAAPPSRPFVKLGTGPNGYISPAPEGLTPKEGEPDLILIMGWTDASLGHVSKYTEAYAKLYPGTTVVLVQIFGNYHWTPTKKTIPHLLPIAKYLKEADPKRVLVHCFSNGGCFNLIDLAHAVAIVGGTTPTPAIAYIFDSCPGAGEWAYDARSFAWHIKNPVAYVLAMAVIHTVFFFVWVYMLIFGIEHMVLKMRRGLLDRSLLSHKPPRTFIYSRADPIIRWKGVEAHAADRRRYGIPVAMDLHHRTAHVNHMREDPDKYWELVQKTWRKGLEISKAP